MTNQERVEKLCVGVLGWTKKPPFTEIGSNGITNFPEGYTSNEGRLWHHVPTTLDSNFIDQCLEKLTDEEYEMFLVYLMASYKDCHEMRKDPKRDEVKADAIIKVKGL